MKENIDAIAVSLEVDSKHALGIVLAADGLINRLGTGSVNNTENDLYIGITKNNLFDNLLSKIDSRWFEHQGSYDVPDKKGKICELTIIFLHEDSKESIWKFRYGSESQGPPDDIRQFVVEAIKLTEPWYIEQKKMVGKSSESNKPWWKFW